MPLDIWKVLSQHSEWICLTLFVFVFSHPIKKKLYKHVGRILMVSIKETLIQSTVVIWTADFSLLYNIQLLLIWKEKTAFAHYKGLLANIRSSPTLSLFLFFSCFSDEYMKTMWTTMTYSLVILDLLSQTCPSGLTNRWEMSVAKEIMKGSGIICVITRLKVY